MRSAIWATFAMDQQAHAHPARRDVFLMTVVLRVSIAAVGSAHCVLSIAGAVLGLNYVFSVMQIMAVKAVLTVLNVQRAAQNAT